jgi:hypothetical protein
LTDTKDCNCFITLKWKVKVKPSLRDFCKSPFDFCKPIACVGHVTLIRRFWLDEISHYLYVYWSNRNRIHAILFIDFVRKRKWRISVTCPTQAMGLQKSNGDLQKSRRLGFTFTFHFNVIKQLQSFVSVNTSFYGP